MTCKNCFHYNACKSLLERMGCIVDGDGIDAEKKCAEFEIKTDRTAPKSGPLQRLIKNLYAYRISTPTTMYHPEICSEAAQAIEALLQELEDERNRHDLLQDWTVARDEEREKMEKKIHALTVERNTLEKRVEYVQKERLALYRRIMEAEEKLWELEEKDNAEL